MKIKTSELTGVSLDWAVIIVNGVPKSDIMLPRKTDNKRWKRIYRLTRDYETSELNGSYMTGPEFLPSSMWESGGPIIEREKLSISAWGTDQWRAQSYWNESYKTYVHVPMVEQYGPTPLIAAMRCFVASKLGDEVEIPEELS